MGAAVAVVGKGRGAPRPVNPCLVFVSCHDLRIVRYAHEVTRSAAAPRADTPARHLAGGRHHHRHRGVPQVRPDGAGRGHAGPGAGGVGGGGSGRDARRAVLCGARRDVAGGGWGVRVPAGRLRRCPGLPLRLQQLLARRGDRRRLWRGGGGIYRRYLSAGSGVVRAHHGAVRHALHPRVRSAPADRGRCDRRVRAHQLRRRHVRRTGADPAHRRQGGRYSRCCRRRVFLQQRARHCQSRRAAADRQQRVQRLWSGDVRGPVGLQRLAVPAHGRGRSAGAAAQSAARHCPRHAAGAGHLPRHQPGLPYALPFAQVASASSSAWPDAPSVAARAVRTFLGARAAPVAALIFLVSTMGSLNGTILTGARVAWASARDGLFFPSFGTLSPRSRVPLTSIVRLCVWAALLATTGTFDQLTNMAVTSYAVFWIPVVLAVIVLRRRAPLAPRPYRLRGYPLAPLLFVAVMVWIVVSAVMTTPKESIATVVLILLGLPFYPLLRRQRAHARSGAAAVLTATPAPRA